VQRPIEIVLGTPSQESQDAVTNSVESRVPRSIAKTISGHSTDSMFTRYAIHEEPEAQKEAQRQAAEYRRRPRQAKVVPLRRNGVR
jgi:hypothetical protein